MSANPSMAQMYINSKKIYKNITKTNSLPDKYDNILLLYVKQLYDTAKNNYNNNNIEKNTTVMKPKLKPRPKGKEVKKPAPPSCVVEIDDKKSEASDDSEVKTIKLSDMKDLNED